MQEKQNHEIERLQKKIRDLSNAYSETVRELEQLKNRSSSGKRRGRPAVSPELKMRVLTRSRQGWTIRRIAEEMDLAVGTIHKIIQNAAKESRQVFVYMDRDMPSTVIDVSGAIQKIKIMNLTDDLINRAFGVREHPSWEDYEAFLEERCMPRTRYGIREELNEMGLDVYDPFQIIAITDGRVYGDGQWLKRLDSEEIEQYDAIVRETKDSEERKARLIRLLRREKGEML